MSPSLQAADVQGSPPGATAEKLISFELRGQRCCIAASAVAEVVHELPASALPDSPVWLAGLAAYLGEPVAVIDPSAIIAGPAPSLYARRPKTIIFRKQPDTAALQYALPIDSLHEIMAVETEKLPAPGSLHIQDLDLGGVPVRFIDPPLLFKHLAAEA